MKASRHHTVLGLVGVFTSMVAIRHTFDLRFRHGMQAEETARRLSVLLLVAASLPSAAAGSSLGRRGRGGIGDGIRDAGRQKVAQSKANKT